MVAGIATFILTWLSLSFVVWLCSDGGTFRETCTHGGVIMMMTMFGWIPTVIVAYDLDKIIKD